MHSLEQRPGSPPSCRVLGVIGEPPNGVSYARFYLPFGHLARYGYALRTLGREIRLRRTPRGWEPVPELLEGVRAVLFPQLVAEPVLRDGVPVRLVEPLCEMARTRGIPVIYSADDHLRAIEPTNPNYLQVQAGLPQLEVLRREAQAVFVTTPSLAQALHDWGAPLFVLPNAVDPARARPRPRRAFKPRIGWAGSSAHLDNLLLVLPALERLRRRRDFELAIFGLCPHELEVQEAMLRSQRLRWSGPERTAGELFLEVASRLRGLGARHVPFGPPDAYFANLAALDLDLGICPLRDSPFSRCKSALKFYEYAAVGTMTVASDVEPYRGEVSVTVPEDTDAWCDTLERYLLDPCGRERELEVQREFVWRERTIERVLPLWREALAAVAAVPRSCARSRP